MQGRKVAKAQGETKTEILRFTLATLRLRVFALRLTGLKALTQGRKDAKTQGKTKNRILRFNQKTVQIFPWRLCVKEFDFLAIRPNSDL